MKMVTVWRTWTSGISMNPDSSMKTMWAASREAFFYPGPSGPLPLLDASFVALDGPAFGLLVAPVHLVEETSHVIAVIPNAEELLDHLGNPAGGPQGGARASGAATLPPSAAAVPMSEEIRMVS